MKITVIGCGRWGSFIARYLSEIGHDVKLYGKESSVHMKQFIQTRRNDYMSLPEQVGLSTDLGSLEDAEAVVISIAAQQVRNLCREIQPHLKKQIPVILCMKGLEADTGKRLTEIITEELGTETPVAVWVGPGHVQDFLNGIPNCMVIDSKDHELTQKLVKKFSGGLIRFYYGTDLIGNEIGAAAKNVIGIAAGVLDGLGLYALKGALMTRGPYEIGKLITACGGERYSAYGLCHLGDYEATVFSKHSHNRAFGENFVKNIPYGQLAEGVYTAKALKVLSDKTGVDMPICRSIYEMIYLKKPAKELVSDLFERSLKKEFV